MTLLMRKKQAMGNDYFMGLALDEAEDALKRGDFPVGCIIADHDRAVATGSRKHSAGNNSNEIDHAEMIALGQLHQNFAGTNPASNLRDLRLFSTMEPCLMCFGAILLSGIGEIVYAYEDIMGGATHWDRSQWNALYRDNHIRITPNVLRSKSMALFKRFFSDPANDYWKDSLLARYTLAQQADISRCDQR